MKTWTKVVLAIAAVPVALLVFSTWYLVRYSMAPAKPFEVNRTDVREHVLIATQGSAFKDAVVQGVVLFTATAYIVLNLLADIAYMVVDPRMRGH